MAQELFDAIRENDKDKVAQLIAANPALAHARNEAGISALMQARYGFRLEIVDLLRTPLANSMSSRLRPWGTSPACMRCWRMIPAWQKPTAATDSPRCISRLSSHNPPLSRRYCTTRLT